MGFIDDLILCTQKGFEEFSKRPCGYLSDSVKELISDYWNGFKVLTGLSVYLGSKDSGEVYHVSVESDSTQEPDDVYVVSNKEKIFLDKLIEMQRKEVFGDD
ncbi:hypothetical protein KY306_03495 [Candidatus Woesearchaeota archaeon]|nr:hypothetical protein [Candidatus Woesearchaeota archaeon]